MYDSHMHIGWFYRKYNSSQRLMRLIHKLNLSKVAVSSTTVCVDWQQALKEMCQICKWGQERIVPVLWITEPMLESEGLRKYLNSGIEWKCIKVHGGLETSTWFPDTRCMITVIDLARKLKLPLLFHTGEFEYCSPGVYRPVIEENKDIKFILAHGRPIKETIDILQNCDNAFADTAFMPISDMCEIVNAGFERKVLWGTDAFINRHFFPNTTTERYYNQRLIEFKSVTTKRTQKLILSENFMKVFLQKED